MSIQSPPSAITNPIALPDDGRPILVATDGQPHADTAMIAAAFLAGRSGRNVRVFSAVEHVALPCRQDGHTPEAVAAEEMQRTQSVLRHELIARRTMVAAQIALTVGAAAEWPIQVHAGPLANVSDVVIADTHAQMLVIGQCRERHVDAPPAACDATEHLINSTIPIYVAAPTLRGLAHRVVVAMDFSETSIRAARLAARFSASDASIYLVHVLARSAASELEERRQLLQWLAESIGTGTVLGVEPIVLLGNAAPETLGFADGIQAELIACGASSLRAALPARPYLPTVGRVTRELIRRASCSVLIAPGTTFPSD